MKYIILLLLIVAGIGGFALYFGGSEAEDWGEPRDHADSIESFEIAPGDVVKKLTANADVILLDVRTHEEYEEIHLESALLLPVQELSKETLAGVGLGEDMKDKEIIIYCRSGARSKTAYEIMESLGYTNVKSIAGGMIHWEEDEYPFMVMKSPRVFFDSVFHDFGVVPQYGGVVRTEFTIRNEGVEILEIGDITTSCSCTSAEASATSIAPGTDAILTVWFDPDFHEEPVDVFKRTVFIPTNDPTMPEAEVTIQVDIDEGN